MGTVNLSDFHGQIAGHLIAPGIEDDHLDTYQQAVVDGLRGIGHALLAIHTQLEKPEPKGCS